MEEFILHFGYCNLLITVILVVFLLAKRLFHRFLTSRIQYNLWFVFFVLLILPFLPTDIFPGIRIFSNTSTLNQLVTNSKTYEKNYIANHSEGWINDFALSVQKNAPTMILKILGIVWLIGIILMFLFLIRSWKKVRELHQSATILQNTKVKQVYQTCLHDLHIKKEIPIYTTAYLGSPVMVGFMHPSIYLPLRVISEIDANEIRYMLLHELCHYKFKDAIANNLMNLVLLVYWFHPFIWYSMKEMRNDREIACDSSVMSYLNEEDYLNYGNALLHYAEHSSKLHFAFVNGIGGTMKQMKRRVLNIALFQKPNNKTKVRSYLIFLLFCIGLIAVTPVFTLFAAQDTYYKEQLICSKYDSIDLSSYFEGYEGCFVLYDEANDSWIFSDESEARTRCAPDSTFKICIGLMGLEQNIITPTESDLIWDGISYPFEDWNQNQDLTSAMQYSVNWYFECILGQINTATIQSYLSQMDYGNQNVCSYDSTFWIESSLLISPIEQVLFLQNLNSNQFHFQDANVDFIKNSLYLYSTFDSSYYGKTGTGNINGENVHGWFIGYVIFHNNTYYFATNIEGDSNTSGTQASEITFSILSYLGISI